VIMIAIIAFNNDNNHDNNTNNNDNDISHW
jgi:hypothetical protein